MSTLLNYVIDTIKSKNFLHFKKLKKNILNADNDYLIRAEAFLNKYKNILENDNKTLDYAVECYIKMLSDFNYESIKFLQTGEYSNKSFEDVRKKVYNNPEIMEYHINGLLLSQFLWIHHYKILKYFIDSIKKNTNTITNYLEIGGGHGLYISEAISLIKHEAKFTLVDISQTSIDLAKKMTNSDNINFIKKNIYDYYPSLKFDFITMGEVLEHVEKPIELLKKVYSLLINNGFLFLTVPINAPAIDHIYLFRNKYEIQNVITRAGFTINNEHMFYTENTTKEMAEKLKIPIMYAGLLSKQK